MKRDMDLIRAILLKIEDEAKDPNTPNLDPLAVPGYKWPEISEHIKLLVESDYLDAIPIDYGLCPTRLTMKGHDFLDSIRNETVWNDVKADVKAKGVALPMEFIKALATQALAKLVGLG